MSCGCQTTPCTCDPQPVCPSPATTKCDLYVPGSGLKNVWIDRGEGPNDAKCVGACMLDTMTEEQIINTLERDDQARADLPKITTDPHLLTLGKTIPRLPVVEAMDAEQAMYNRPNEGASIPFYALFRGQPPFSQ
jgi:hypothetical protein